MVFKNTLFKKTLFKQYLFTTTVILITSFITLGGTLLMFISKYWEEEKHDLLHVNAKAVSGLIANNSKVINNSLFIIDNSLTHGIISILSSNIDSDIFVTNTEGETLLCCEGSQCKHYFNKIPPDIIHKALSEEYTGITDLGIYDYDCYIVAIPVIMNTKDDNIPLGVVFISTDAGYISVFRNNVFNMLILASLLAFGISFFIMWILSYNLVKPLSEMSEAAKRFAKGDFSKRVHVRRTDEIGQLSIAFNNMADSLSKSEDTRRSFIANVSHELKTPMTTISGFIDGILDGTIPETKMMHYLNIVATEIKRLSRLVTTMLNLSRIDSGGLKLNYHHFDITEIVFKSLLSFEARIEEKSIEIRGLEDSKPVFIDGDPDMIHQVIYNLIENAVKFTNENGYIEVKIVTHKNNVLVSIKNSGQGIPKGDLKFIFDRFYKTDKSRSQDKNGMGLGLYIVKTIVELHNGTISVDSVEGEYCTFEFYIPYNKSKHTSDKLFKETMR